MKKFDLAIPTLTMSSVEIAELLGKRHNNVARDIRKMLADLEKDVLKFEHIFLDKYGREQLAFALPRRECFILISGYSVKLRAKIVDRWMELEAKQAVSYANPPRKGLLENKRVNHWDMTEALLECRTEAGKPTKAHHYMCENKLCNWAVTGKFEKIDESTLSNEDAELLGKVRIQNAAMIRIEMPYEERKSKLMAFAMRWRTKRIAA